MDKKNVIVAEVVAQAKALEKTLEDNLQGSEDRLQELLERSGCGTKLH